MGSSSGTSLASLAKMGSVDCDDSCLENKREAKDVTTPKNLRFFDTGAPDRS